MPDSELSKKIEGISRPELSVQEKSETQSEKNLSFEKLEDRSSFDNGRAVVLEEIEGKKNAELVGGLAGASNAQKERQQKIKEVEKILEEDMQDIFISLPPAKQEEFKKTGEEITKKIINLLDKAKIKIGDVIKLIKQWLSIVPGINKFFLEQESKIKADEIIKIKEQ